MGGDPGTGGGVGSHVVAGLSFLVDDREAPFTYMYKRQDGGRQRHGTWKRKMVPIFDARPMVEELTLDKHAFALVPHRSALSTTDFYEDPKKITTLYYAEMEALVKRATGASRVIVFDHIVRNLEKAKERAKELGAEKDFTFEPVHGYADTVHNDYNAWSAPERIKDLAKPNGEGGFYTVTSPLVSAEELPALLKNRYVFINIWQNISEEPVQADPLTVCDMSSCSEEHFVESRLIYKDRVGGTHAVLHHDSQRWCYFSQMRKDEALLLKVMDSKQGISRWTAHSSFKFPNVSSGEKPSVRESIEARVIAFFAPGDEERTAVPAWSTLFGGSGSDTITTIPASKL